MNETAKVRRTVGWAASEAYHGARAAARAAGWTPTRARLAGWVAAGQAAAAEGTRLREVEPVDGTVLAHADEGGHRGEAAAIRALPLTEEETR